MKERRRFERLSKQESAYLEFEGKKSEIQLLNVSVGGMSFFSPFPLKLGSLVKGEFRIFPNVDPFFIRGRVVWIKEEEGNWQVGIEFRSISTFPFPYD